MIDATEATFGLRTAASGGGQFEGWPKFVQAQPKLAREQPSKNIGQSKTASQAVELRDPVFG